MNKLEFTERIFAGILTPTAKDKAKIWVLNQLPITVYSFSKRIDNSLTIQSYFGLDFFTKFGFLNLCLLINIRSSTIQSIK